TRVILTADFYPDKMRSASPCRRRTPKMDERPRMLCIAFAGARRVAAGELAQVALKTKAVIDRGVQAPILLFDDATSEPIELDFRGTPDDVLTRLAGAEGPPASAAAAPVPEGEAPRGPGRPKLGV